ncbi:MAG: cyclic pyranopterin monophosphate synthase MoaC [Planctomycetes bacterium]|nr:cyclic pyranopterin monophosphate synthase MoaC [Planctomycetota bacterium]
MSREDQGFTHFDAEGKARMVDVGEKAVTHRVAEARAQLRMSSETLRAIRDGAIEKGTVLGVARVAGIMAAKKTGELIPLCHPLFLTRVEIEFEFEGDDLLVIDSRVEVRDRTGVEMEALCACSVAALTVYDMCKSRDRGMTVERLGLRHKSGGRSGTWEAPDSDS